jgi:hypothetical protein
LIFILGTSLISINEKSGGVSYAIGHSDEYFKNYQVSFSDELNFDITDLSSGLNNFNDIKNDDSADPSSILSNTLVGSLNLQNWDWLRYERDVSSESIGILNSNESLPWDFGDAVVVSTESTENSRSSAIVVDSLNNLHVVWYDDTNYESAGTDTDIFYKQWNNSNSQWGDTVVVSTESSSTSTHPAIAVDSLDNLHVVWYDFTDYDNAGSDADIFYKQWNSSNSQWGDTVVVSTESSSGSFHPTIMVDSLNNLHVVWHDYTDYDNAGSDADIFYKQWNSSNSQWGDTVVVSTESSSNSFFPVIAVDSLDNLHLVWHDSTNYTGSDTDFDIFYKQWNSSNSQWGDTVVVSTESSLGSEIPTIAVDNNNNLHVVWQDITDYDSAGNDTDIFYKQWNSSSSQWGDTEVVSTESSSNSLHSIIAVDNYNNLHVVWQDFTDYDSAGTDADIFYKQWNSSISEWCDTMVMSTESSSGSFFPVIAVDSLDNLHLAWHDATNYTGSDTDFDIFYKKGKLNLFLGNLTGLNDFSYEHGSSNNKISWNAADSNPHEHFIYRNGILISDGTWQSDEPIELNIDGLDVGTYNFTIIVTNQSNNLKTHTVFVTVEDTTPPIFTSTPNYVEYFVGTTGNQIAWIATDTLPDDYAIYRNSILIDNGIWTSGESIILVIDGLSIGMYNYTIIVFDITGYSANHSVFVSVIEEDTTETSETDKDTKSDDTKSDDTKSDDTTSDEETQVSFLSIFNSLTWTIMVFGFVMVVYLKRRVNEQ